MEILQNKKKKNETENLEECVCVTNANIVSGKNYCKCKTGYLGNDETNECNQLIDCENFTKQKDIENNIEECVCVTNSHIIEGENRCECDDDCLPDLEKNECNKIIHCGDLTLQKNNTQNIEACDCVSNAHIIEGENKCECDEGWYLENNANDLCVKCDDNCVSGNVLQ